MKQTTRRQFIGQTSALLAAASIRQANSAGTTSAQNSRPNIIVILVDDLGFGDLNRYGSDDLLTPNMDSIGDQGARFQNAYSNCPVCSPTRAALLSGRFQDMVGVPGVIRTHLNNSWGYLSPDARLLPEILQQQGYQTACIGKWHLGLEPPNLPNQRGFGHFKGFLGDMMDDYNTHLRHGNNYMRDNDKEIDPEGHATDLFSDWAADYIKQQSSANPFFLYLAYNAPHAPIQPPQEFVDRYRDRHPNADAKRAKIAGFIEHLDEGVGRVLSALKQSGFEENTLVVFASDNGGRRDLGASNGQWRDNKGTLYEGGIRVPMSAQWPGSIPSGQTTDRIALSMDIMPTVLQAAGIQPPGGIEGRSFLPTLRGETQAEEVRDLFFTRREGGKFKGGRIACIRRGDWKLLQPMPGEPYELYNLADDPFERQELTKAQPKVSRELASALEAQLARYDKVPWKPSR